MPVREGRPPAHIRLLERHLQQTFSGSAVYLTCIRSPQNTTPTALSAFRSPELVSIPIYPYASRNLTTEQKTFLFLLLSLLSLLSRIFFSPDGVVIPQKRNYIIPFAISGADENKGILLK